MFDVGFQELALIFGVSLVVLGPKRLPGLVTKAGRWVGKARSMARDFRQQLENEVNLEELNKMTALQTGQASENSTPVPPPEFTGAPPPDSVPTYPYSAPDAEAAQTDDTWSHAHAAGDAPMPYEPEPPLAIETAPESVPAQASFDLSPDNTPGTTDTTTRNS